MGRSGAGAGQAAGRAAGRAAGHRVRWPGPWPVAGASLALAGAAEAVYRTHGSGAVLSLAILVDAAATFPLVLARDRIAAAAAAVTVAAAAACVLHGGIAVAPLAALVTAWTVLVRRRVARRRAEAAALDASRRVFEHTLLEHTARGERARIARELHDVVAHHISMISVQAETARLAVPGMPAEGAERLLAIGGTARTALTEMRRLLGVLREDAGAEPTRLPQPGLGQLLDLVDETRDAGAAGVRLILRGDAAVLDPGLELAAYRIVQEALTNARRHAPGAAVDVEIEYTPGVLRVSVRDNGPGPAPGAPHGGGHGVLGMRERAAAVGGELRAGPGPVGGFLVEATLPAAETS
ncbi:sensor histidine kinase [Actinomadura welshii]